MKTAIVITSSVDPKSGDKLLVEPTMLPLIEALFYDEEGDESDWIQPVLGWLTVIGGKAYRVRQIDPDKVEGDAEVFETVVEWDDLEVKPTRRADNA